MTLNNFTTGGGHFNVIFALLTVLHVTLVVPHVPVFTLIKSLLAQTPLGAVEPLFTHQQEHKLTIWFIGCLGHGR